MNDTPEHIKALQLKFWLSKPPEERLKQFMTDNDALMQFWKNAKDHLQEVHHETKPFFGEDCESCDK